MNMTAKFFGVIAIAGCLCGCLGPVLRVGDRFIPLKNHHGVPVVSAPNSIYKEIHYSTFGFDWDEKDGFIIPPQRNSLNRAFWASELTRKEKLYSVLFTADKRRHYLQNPDIKTLKAYLEGAYRELPGSKIKRMALDMEQCKFKGEDAIRVYMETFEKGRDLYLREVSYYFFDPREPQNLIYTVSWSERGKKEDWRTHEAEVQGKRFLECFKLLPRKN